MRHMVVTNFQYLSVRMVTTFRAMNNLLQNFYLFRHSVPNGNGTLYLHHLLNSLQRFTNKFRVHIGRNLRRNFCTINRFLLLLQKRLKGCTIQI